MIGAPNSLNLNCKAHVMKEAPDISVSEEIADIFTNYNIDNQTRCCAVIMKFLCDSLVIFNFWTNVCCCVGM